MSLTPSRSWANLQRTAAPTPNPDGSPPAGSLDGARGVHSSGGLVARFLRCAAEGGGRGGADEESPMTVHSDLKKLIRDRKVKTGESYTTARVHILRERAERLGRDD